MQPGESDAHKHADMYDAAYLEWAASPDSVDWDLGQLISPEDDSV